MSLNETTPDFLLSVMNAQRIKRVYRLREEALHTEILLTDATRRPKRSLREMFADSLREDSIEQSETQPAVVDETV